MDSLFGIVGDGYVLLAADQSQARGILVFKNDEDKIMPLDSFKAVAIAGPQGDRTQFGEYLQRNMKLNELRTGLTMSTHACANYVRTELATALRSRGAYQVNLLLGGFDKKSGKPSLYWMDYLAAMQKMNFGAHGYGSNFTVSLMDREWKEGMTLDEGKTLLGRCIEELKTRFLVAQPNFVIKLVDKDGTRVITL